jgi:hypothetical protein
MIGELKVVGVILNPGTVETLESSYLLYFSPAREEMADYQATA